MYQYEGAAITKVLKPESLPENYTIPSEIDGVLIRQIGPEAFKNCTAIKELTIPDSIVSIKSAAFRNCANIAKINFNAPNCSVDVNGLFYGKNGVTKVVFGNIVKTIPSYVCKGMSALKDVVFGDSVTSIDASAFENCSGLEDITLPESIARIEKNTFLGCSSLSSINLDNIVTVGECAFKNCKALEPEFSDKLSAIESGAFFNCTSIKELTIPESVNSTGSWAFKGCTNIAKINFNAPDCKIHLTGLFNDNNNSVTTVVFGEKVKNIPAYACKGLTLLKTVRFSSRIKGIGEEAFSKCPQSFDIYYPGTESQWAGIAAATVKNDNIKSAKTYNTDMEYIWVHCEGNKEPAPVSFTLTYNANGGNGVPAAQSGNGNITLSAVKPFRDGYTFLGWAQSSGAASAQYLPGASYNLGSDTTLYAVWQKNADPDNPGFDSSAENPTAYALIYIKKTATVSYRTKVIVTATANNVPSGYYLAIYEGGIQRVKGDNKSVTYDAGEMRESTTFTVKVVDGKNNVQKDTTNHALSKECTVTVNSDFFARLIAFFQGIFGLIPQTEIKP